MRGASSIGFSWRKAATLYEMSLAEAETLKVNQPQFYFRLDGAKANYDPKNPTEWFERVPIKLDNGEITAAAQLWEPPTELNVTDMLIDQLLAVVASGDQQGRPWSSRLSSGERSIRQAMNRLGITTNKSQEKAVASLRSRGVEDVAWRRPDRNPAMGMRTSDGRPAVRWL
jgi:hypothetical protein